MKNFQEEQAKFVFLHKDYLGSILAITNEAGNVVEQRHYDAWGSFTHLKIGNATIITDKDVIRNSSLLIERGYTSHEHFAEVGIIHMNGRLYDPLLRRFLNADEHIQDPHNTQNYNKYGYVLNNPLMYNDPSGEFFQFLALAIFWKAVGIGIATGLASAVISAGLSGQQISIGGILKSAFISGISAAVTFGIGSVFSVAADTGKYVMNLVQNIEKVGESFAVSLVQAGMHAVSQGVLNLVQGSNFLTGATSAFLGSLGATGWTSMMGTSGAAMISFGALAGGVGTELTGGNFWQGAITGGIVAGLNHAMHKMTGPGDPPKKKTQWDLNKDGKISLGEANQHWKSGKGEQIFVEANSVDLNFLDITGWEAGKDYNVQTLFGSREGRVFGNIRVHYLGDNKVSIYPDVYDFDQHGKFMSSPVTILR